mmetsp:Transcript_25150/g.30676  ORF Transcript_25150/g.30676 Transcript_25150/m.30676 type:complete len:146 (+) Transcript_25150:278-715(+)
MMVSVLEDSIKRILDYPDGEVIGALTVNARSIMNNDGLLDVTPSAFVDFIFAKILRATTESHRIHLLYLCDSVIKHIPQYVHIFKKQLPRIFLDIWKGTTGYRKQLLYDLLVTWEQYPFPEMDNLVYNIRLQLYRIGEGNRHITI